MSDSPGASTPVPHPDSEHSGAVHTLSICCHKCGKELLTEYGFAPCHCEVSGWNRDPDEPADHRPAAQLENPRTKSQEAAMKTALEFVETFDADQGDTRGLYIFGETRGGKSHVARAIASKLMFRGYSVRFWEVPMLLTRLKMAINSGEYEAILDRKIHDAQFADLIIFDDLGAERETPFAAEILTSIFMYRERSAKPIIVTSNAGPEDLKDFVGERIAARVLEWCDKILIKGKPVK